MHYSFWCLKLNKWLEMFGELSTGLPTSTISNCFNAGYTHYNIDWQPSQLNFLIVLSATPHTDGFAKLETQATLL